MFCYRRRKDPTKFRKVYLRNVSAVLCVCEKAGDHEQREETKMKNTVSVEDTTKLSYKNLKNQRMQFRIQL